MSKHLSTHSGLTQFGNILMRVCIILSMVLSNMAIQTAPVSADSEEATRVEKVDLENAWDRPLTWLEDVGDKIGGLGEGLFKGEETFFIAANLMDTFTSSEIVPTSTLTPTNTLEPVCPESHRLLTGESPVLVRVRPPGSRQPMWMGD